MALCLLEMTYEWECVPVVPPCDMRLYYELRTDTRAPVPKMNRVEVN